MIWCVSEITLATLFSLWYYNSSYSYSYVEYVINNLIF